MPLPALASLASSVLPGLAGGDAISTVTNAVTQPLQGLAGLAGQLGKGLLGNTGATLGGIF
ncbi:hypothetical protein [Mitsuaria sp. GD03876]|uniref:hypothetical protein n=1 Tax=Mitsuaria sp. GD03876 TaxID=2975399 RepID=UPI00244706BC|nr:hypothetical protein [Mitsuaria sp. GD03876]MDH0867573.1 hypothetical protein [Mitsuaria sp. GD03876]